MKTVISLLIFSVLMFSCQSAAEKKKVMDISSEQIANVITGIQSTRTTEKELPGGNVYATNCLTCHQADGSGVPGMYPPLGPGSWVGNDPKELIAIMMKGLNGQIEVNGEVYKDFMPSHAQMSDQEIADVLTYIRSSFGNNYEPVAVEMVTKIRKGK